MTSTTKDAGLTTIPPLKVEQSEKTEKIADRPSGIPVPSRPTNGLKEKTTTSRHKHSIGHRFLSPAEWARVAHGLGAVHDGESHTVVHPTSFYWPPKGLPDGLYRDVIYQKTKYAYKHQVLSNIRWALMILQIIIGAVLTSLGSLDLKDGTPITIFAAVNTVGAGLLALMHNSGLPDRYRLDKVEYSKVADFIKVRSPHSCGSYQVFRPSTETCVAGVGTAGHGRRGERPDRG